MMIDSNTTRKYPRVYRHLMAVSLLGAIYKSREDADAISAAVELTLVDATQFRMFRAIAQGMGGDAEYAAEVVGKHLDENPDDDIAKVTLGVSKMLAGKSDWKQSIDTVLATSTDQAVRAAANSVIDYLDTLKKH